jgi:predicted GIY-YIG superfamily endonuclease
MIKDQIYALYYDYNDRRHYFYVGRTNDPARRLSEHRRNANDPEHTEDVYEFIRKERQPNGIDLWDMELLWTQPNGRSQDCEDFWVVLLIRADNKLKNMKRGDLHRLVLETTARKQGEFQDVDEFVEFRDRVERETKQQLEYARSRRVIDSVLEETPNPHIDVQALLASVIANRTEADLKRAEQLKKKALRERANILERDAWLENLRSKGMIDKEGDNNG